MTRWLAIYFDDGGKPRAAIITPSEQDDFPFDVDLGNLTGIGLSEYGSGATLVQLPDDPEFRPMIVDNDADEEIAIQFIDL